MTCYLNDDKAGEGCVIENMATVAVYVEDQQKSLEFWTEQVGFTVLREEQMTPEERWVEVGPEGAETHLVIYPRSLMPNWEELKPSIVFQCSDIGDTVEELRGNGVEVSDEIREMRWGKYASFKDIDGNEFLLKGELESP